MRNAGGMSRHKTITDHIALLESRHSEQDRRIAVAALKSRLYELQKKSRSRFHSFLVGCRSRVAFGLLRFVPDLVIKGYLPGKIGRYRVVDSLVFWSEQSV